MPLINLVVRAPMPATRGECVNGPRPCPFVHCRHHLAAKLLTASHRLKVRFVPRGQDTCALDVADRGHHTLSDIGRLLGITRERVRQIEIGALEKLRAGLAQLEGSEASALEAFRPEGHCSDEPNMLAIGQEVP